MTRRMIVRSREQLAVDGVTQDGARKVWHPERPEESAPDPKRTDEARRVVQQWIDDQRQLADKLRRKMN